MAVLLADDATVTAVRGTGDKFFVGIDLVPDTIERPFQHCVVTNTEPERHLAGRNGFVATTFDIDNYADDSGTCLDLARVSRLALDGYKGVITDGNDALDVIYIHWLDETHVTSVALSGSDRAVAYIRQQYEMFTKNPAG